MPAQRSEKAVPAQGQPLILRPTFVALIIPALIAGSLSGFVDVAIPAMETGLGGSAVVGLALGLFAAGSALGGLLYGGLKLPGSLVRQLLSMTAVLVVLVLCVASVQNSVALMIILVAAGLFFSPVMVVAYIAAPAAAGVSQQNAATTWVNTGYNLGSAIASALAGVLIQHAGVPTSVLSVCAGALLLLLASGLIARFNGSSS